MAAFAPVLATTPLSAAPSANMKPRLILTPTTNALRAPTLSAPGCTSSRLLQPSAAPACPRLHRRATRQAPAPVQAILLGDRPRPAARRAASPKPRPASSASAASTRPASSSKATNVVRGGKQQQFKKAVLPTGATEQPDVLPDVVFCTVLGLCVAFNLEAHHQALQTALEYGPADLPSAAFGPMLSYTSSTASTAAASAAAAAASSAAQQQPSAAAAAAAAQHLSHLTQIAGGASAAAAAAASGAAASAQGLAGHVWDSYNAWLAVDPLVCKIVTGNIFTVAGDLLAQATSGADAHGGGGDDAAPSPSEQRRGYDAMRTLRLCVETSFFGTPLAHWWFNFLEANVFPDDPHGHSAVIAKLVLDQTVLAPLGLAMFFCVLKCLEGRPMEIPETLRTKYWKAAIGGWMLWPAATLINFSVVPLQYRVLFSNVVNILWTCFLSSTQAGKPTPPSLDSTSPASPTPAAAAASEPAAAMAAADAVAAPAHALPAYAFASMSSTSSLSSANAYASWAASPPSSSGSGSSSGLPPNHDDESSGSATSLAADSGRSGLPGSLMASLTAVSMGVLSSSMCQSSSSMACLVCLAGIAAVEVAMVTHGSLSGCGAHAHAAEPASVPAPPLSAVSAGAMVEPCLQLLPEPVDALAETL